MSKFKPVDNPTVIHCAKCHAVLTHEKGCKCDAGWYTEADVKSDGEKTKT